MKMKAGEIVFDSNGRFIKFVDCSNRLWIVPLSTFSMRSDEEYYFFTNDQEDIEVDQATWLRAETLLIK